MAEPTAEELLIRGAASAITELWWTNPTENAHVKTRAVENIIRNYLGGAQDRWEYCVSQERWPNKLDVSGLNALGAQGWELVGLNRYEGWLRYFFKRRITGVA